jgi:hypothetical protein
MPTYDSRTIDSAGAFLVGELERLDRDLHLPLANVTWNRDIRLREDVTIGDEATSFVNTDFGVVGSAGSGKNWVSPQANAIAQISMDTSKTTQPLRLWAMALGWSIPELTRAQQLGRPIDTQKHEGLTLKFNMDTDEQVYIGDEALGSTGLVNNPDITPDGYDAAWAADTAPDTILSDINDLIAATWERSAYAVCPDTLLLPPAKFAHLTRPVTTAGSASILSYVSQQCLSAVTNGRPLAIRALKWLTGRGEAGVDRAVAYTDSKAYVRFPMVPLQRTPLEHRGIHQLTTYFGALGEVEFVYPETVGYADGL